MCARSYTDELAFTIATSTSSSLPHSETSAGRASRRHTQAYKPIKGQMIGQAAVTGPDPTGSGRGPGHSCFSPSPGEALPKASRSSAVQPFGALLSRGSSWRVLGGFPVCGFQPNLLPVPTSSLATCPTHISLAAGGLAPSPSKSFHEPAGGGSGLLVPGSAASYITDLTSDVRQPAYPLSDRSCQ